ncbi:MAG: nitrogen fixation protein NifX [Hyphomicrobiaceae bacterium]|nr:nitrogen fixation protein NifX [Hyphomicrobiaceae bacterium]
MLARRLKLIDDGDSTMTTDSSGPRLKIAIATQDMEWMNAHFGSAKKFAVYEVTPAESKFIEAFGFGDVSDESGAHKTEGDDRITPKVDALTGCNLLFVLAIGGPAAAKVVSAKIHPVKLTKPEPIADVIAKVQAMMTGNPPPWLRKVMGATAPARDMAFLDD